MVWQAEECCRESWRVLPYLPSIFYLLAICISRMSHGTFLTRCHILPLIVHPWLYCSLFLFCFILPSLFGMSCHLFSFFSSSSRVDWPFSFLFVNDSASGLCPNTKKPLKICYDTEIQIVWRYGYTNLMCVSEMYIGHADQSFMEPIRHGRRFEKSGIFDACKLVGDPIQPTLWAGNMQSSLLKSFLFIATTFLRCRRGHLEIIQLKREVRLERTFGDSHFVTVSVTIVDYTYLVNIRNTVYLNRGNLKSFHNIKRPDQT